MIIEKTGKITEDLYLLGDPSMPLYLVDGERPAIVDTAFSFLADGYADAVTQVLGDRQPAFCLLTHSHFDHVGGVAGLKRRFPDMSVVASPRAALMESSPRPTIPLCEAALMAVSSVIKPRSYRPMM